MTREKRSNKTVSARKLAANRANAQKSTGPKTPEGKQRTARNAITHGLYTNDIVLPDDPDESPEEFDALREALIHDIQPANMIERLLVERLAVAHWRLRRVYRHEAVSIIDARTRDATDIVKTIPRQLGLSHGADLPIQLPPAYALDAILRYESNLNRTISQIMHYLIQLRTSAKSLFPTQVDPVPQPDCPPEPPLPDCRPPTLPILSPSPESRVPNPDTRHPIPDTPAVPDCRPPTLPIADSLPASPSPRVSASSSPALRIPRPESRPPHPAPRVPSEEQTHRDPTESAQPKPGNDLTTPPFSGASGLASGGRSEQLTTPGRAVAGAGSTALIANDGQGQLAAAGLASEEAVTR